MNNSKEFYFDPSILRKSKIVDEALNSRLDWVLPSVVEISESGTCNRACSFCPRSDPNYPDVKEFIDPMLLEKLVVDLSSHFYSGVVLFSGFVEPMLDKNIYEHISCVRRHLKNSKIEMVTNGDALNIERIKKLKSSGLSTLLISVYDGENEANNFESMCLEAELAPSDYVIRHRYLPPEQNFGITINNRSGMMKNAAFPIEDIQQPLNSPCYYPHYTFFMDYLGDVLICPHDWGKKRVVGNIKRQTFKEIWLGRGYEEARKMLFKGNRKISPCNKCDVDGTLIGLRHAEQWNSIKGT